MLTRHPKDAPRQLTGISAIPTQTVRPYFRTRLVPQIRPVHVKFAVVVHVHELMSHGTFHVSPAVEIRRAEDDGSTLRVISSCARLVAGTADKIPGWDATTAEGKVLEHEGNNGRIIDQPLLVFFATRNIAGLP